LKSASALKLTDISRQSFSALRVKRPRHLKVAGFLYECYSLIQTRLASYSLIFLFSVDKAENKANNVVYHIADKPMTMDEWEQKWCSAGENVSN
jgi:hypothetical protein